MEMKNRNTRQPRSRTKLPIIIAAVVVLLLLLVLGALLLFGNGQQPEPTEPSGSIETSQPTESSPPAVEVPVKVWDMEALPEDLVAAGMAYASSSENIPGNIKLGAGAGKGFGGTQAFRYHYVGNASAGDIYIMSPFALNDPTLITDWSQGEMLWFWVNGTELLQTVRLEVCINGKYPVTGTTYYTIDEKGSIQVAGEIPAASTSSGSRGRIHITAGQEGWIGVPLSMYDNPKVLSSIQIVVGNSTIKAGNTLYLDEFWVTKMDQTPDMPMAELLYKTTDSLTHGGIWDVEDVEAGTVAGDMYDTEGRLDATGTVYAGKGVLGSQAWGYKMLEVNGAHTQNLSMLTSKMAQFGYQPRAIKSSTDILWFWIDSDLSADQRLHLQLNDVSTACWKSIYTIRNNGGTPELQEIPFVSNEGQVVGVGLVPHDGKTAGLYSRLKISAGWSGWVGIPVENFCVSPSGETLPVPSSRVNRLLMRLNGAANSMQVGDTLYFDELWVTGAGEMPQLSKEALLYGYTPAYVKEPITYGKLWGVDHTNLQEGMQIGQIHNRDDRNEVTTNIAPGRGVGGGMAWAYTVLNSIANNSANVDLFPAELDKVGFQFAKITAQTDVLWFWLDSNAATDQILHLQLNDGTVFMSQQKKIYTIEDVDGTATLKEVGFHADAAALTEGIGLIPISGYARIKVCAGWSGWIGVPVENFCVTGTGEAASVKHETVNAIIMRGYVTSKDLLQEEDSFFFDEFWLTPAGKMPELSNEQLLYKAPADPVLEFDGMFTSSMILQQNKPWIVRGKGEAGMTVTVKLVDKDGNAVQTRQTYVEKDGLWTVTMEAVTGGYDAYKLVITSGTAKKTVKDLVFGEVWVAGGQSNMAYNIETTNPNQAMLTPEAREALKLRLEANANASYIRCFMQALGYLGDEARTEPSGKWLNGAVWSQVEDCSATAFLFAEALQAKLDVPVGVVVPARGGKGLSSFVDKETAAEYEAFYQMIQDKGFLSPDSGDSNYLSGWYNSLVSGWKGYEVSGMIWYQGEHDINQRQIQELGIEVLIASWSKVFNSEETVDALPFVGIQLAPYNSEGADSSLSANYYLNESIRKGIDKVVAAGGKAVAVPIYDLPIELDNIHPNNKPMVGTRVAEVAYGMVYGQEDAVISGPVLKDVDYSVSGKVILTFDKIAQGLKYIRLTEQDNLRILPEGHSYDVSDFYADKLNGFTIWTGRKLIPADAVIDPADPSKVIITLPEGEQALGVYYGFGIEVLSANLYNSENLPALPFRHVREGADQVDLSTPLWNLDESNAALTDKTINSATNRNQAILERSEYTGLMGTNALCYGYATAGKQSTVEAGLKSAAALSANGFRTDVLINDGDIIWFWAKSDMPNAMRVQPAFSGKQLKGSAFAEGSDVNEALYIYTIVENASGKPEMQKIYHTRYASQINGLGYVNPKSDDTGAYGQLKLSAGWSGWIGIPVDMLVNGGLQAGDTINSMSFYMIMFEDTDGSLSAQQSYDAIYLDEFWLASAGKMPALPDSTLLYSGPETELTFNSRYDSGMIFQYGKPWMLHGTGEPGETVSITLMNGNQTVKTESVTVAADGSWQVNMPAMEGGYTQYTVIASSGDNVQRLQNVVFGEVWVAGGQSNMEYTIGQINEDEREALKKRLQSNVNEGFIRIHNDVSTGTLLGEQKDVTGGWLTADNWANVEKSSAIGMYYAELLQQKLDMPVGIVVAAKGGSSIGAWLDRDLVSQYDELYEILTEQGYLVTTTLRNRVSAHFDGAVAPWQGYSATGILWYQGEQDRFAPDIQTYAIEALVDSWSGVFSADGSRLPIAAIQIAPFAGSATEPDTGMTMNTELNRQMREGIQRLVASGGTGVVIPVHDFSVVLDNIHPLNKQVVGQRVFNVIWQTLYDGAAGNEVYPGPQLTDVEFTDGKAILTFDRTIKHIQLNTTDNNRTYRTDNAFLPLPEDLYADKLNGFSIFTGSEYVSVEATIVDGNKVELSIPAGTTVKAVCYGYGMEVLAANMYSEDNYPALPFSYDGSYSAPLWNLDESDNAFTNVFIATGGTRNPAIFQRVPGKGLGLSNALMYGFSEVKAISTYESGLKAEGALAGNGFDSSVVLKSNDDILWFWVDSDVGVDIRMQPQFNGQQLKGAAFAEGSDVNTDLYVYTIVRNASGQPQMEKVYYTKYDSTITGLGYVSANANNNTTYGQLKFADGWSGWVGIPANMLRGSSVVEGVGITAMSYYLIMNIGVDGTLEEMKPSGELYFDEFWLTSANAMPDLRDKYLLYTAEYAAPVWDLDESDEALKDKFVATGGSRNESILERVPEMGINGSNALAYGQSTAGKGTTFESGLKTAAVLKSNGVNTDAIVSNVDDVIWFWMDSDMANDMRLQVAINGDQLIGGIFDGTDANEDIYIYTITKDADGKPQVEKVIHREYDAAIEGIGLVNPRTDGSGTYSQIKLANGWYGWVGIPVNMLRTGSVRPGDSLESVTFYMSMADGVDGSVSSQREGDCIYIDEMWITGAGQIPGLNEEELFYNGDIVNEKLWDLDESDAELTGFTVAGGNRNIPTLQRVPGKGVLGTSALKYSLTTVGKNTGSEIGWNDATGATLQADGFRTDLQIQADDDVLWFWMDSDMSTAFRMAFMVNGQGVVGGKAEHFIYYIAEDNGEPVMKKAMHSSYDTVSEPVALVNYSTNNTHRNSRIRISDGWSGWIGIPANMFDRGVLSATNNKINQLRIFMNWDDALDGGLKNQKVGDSIYFDSFYITSNGEMPDVSKEALLYSGDYQAPLWDLDESDAALTGFTVAGGNRNIPTLQRVTGKGVLGTSALKYSLTSVGKGTGSEIGWNDATGATLQADGFRNDLLIRADDDVLWFWMDSDMSTAFRMAFMVNGQGVVGGNDEYFIYYIAEDNGEPVMKKAMHSSYDTVSEPVALVNYSTNNTHRNSRIRISDGWSGWIGIPANMFDRSVLTTTNNKINQLRIFMNWDDALDGGLANQVIGDSIYFDNFHITSDGEMPDVSKEALLYDGDAYSVTTDGTGYQLLWDLDESDAALSGFTVASGNRNVPTLQRVPAKGVLGTGALKYSLTTVGKNTGSEIGWNDATGATLQADGFRTDLQIQANDDILWFWMDSDMSTAFRMAFMVNGQGVVGGNDEYFIHYIVEENGVPVMKKAMHSSYDTVSEPVALVNYSINNTHRNSRIRISDGWSGWIGIPANMFDRSVLTTTNNKINQLRIFMNWDDALDGGLANQVIGDTIYFDNFCITSANKMPPFADQILLYSGD